MSHYDRLGVRADASPEEIRKAYRDKAKATHPDASQHLPPEQLQRLEDEFKAVNTANEVLSDPTRRAGYDAELTVMATLLDMFEVAVSEIVSHPYAAGGDPFGALQGMLGQRFEALQANLYRAHVRSNGLAAILGRAQRRDGNTEPNPFRDCLKALYDRAQDDMQAVQAQLQQLHHMRAILSEYVWVVSRPAKPPPLSAAALRGTA